MTPAVMSNSPSDLDELRGELPPPAGRPGGGIPFSSSSTWLLLRTFAADTTVA